MPEQFVWPFIFFPGAPVYHVGQDTAYKGVHTVSKNVEAKAGCFFEWVPVVNKTLGDPDVSPQMHVHACGPATGQMLLTKQGINLFQSNIAGEMGSVLSTTRSLEYALNKFQAGWRARQISNEDFLALCREDSFGAMVFEGGYWHWLVIDGLTDAGNVKIRDPLPVKVGSKYEIPVETFMNKCWTGDAIYRPKK